MLIALTLLCIPLITGAPVATPGQESAQARREDCGPWEDCRDQALAAAAREDFERFHDLAWRAVQKGPRNDPALMTLLARAQSLSGRPGDALVMLERLLAMGVAVTGAADSEDFHRVRALPGWEDLRARIAAASPGAGVPAFTRAVSNVPSTPLGSAPIPAAGAIPPPVAPADAAAEAGATGGSADDEPGTAGVEDALRFTTIPFEPAGLAYDAVSNRFIVGDRRARKLIVIGERSQRLTNLAGEVSAGFGEIEAMALDAGEGDLWVASTPDGNLPPKLHKLQLISGRVLFTAVPADALRGARITDIAVTREGFVLALDSAGGRLLELEPGSRALQLLAPLEVADPVSLAPAPDGTVYVAGAGGVTRVDRAGRARPLKAPVGVHLGGLEWIRWHRGALVGVQAAAGGLFHIVRLRLDGAGRTVARAEVLERDVAMVSSSSVVLRGNALFYLGRQTAYTATGGMDVVIRRVRLR